MYYVYMCMYVCKCMKRFLAHYDTHDTIGRSLNYYHHHHYRYCHRHLQPNNSVPRCPNLILAGGLGGPLCVGWQKKLARGGRDDHDVAQLPWRQHTHTYCTYIQYCISGNAECADLTADPVPSKRTG